MTGDYWKLVAPECRLERLAPGVLLLFTDNSSMIVSVRMEREGRASRIRVKSQFAFLNNSITGKFKPRAKVKECVEEMIGSGGRAMLLPPLVSRKKSSWVFYGWLAIPIFLTVVLLNYYSKSSLLQLLIGLAGIYIAGPIGIAIGAMVFGAQRWEILGQERLGVTPGNVHEYALAVERGELWRGALPAGAAVSPELQVERIRGEYGRLRGDLVYRVECPALFDPVVPRTAAFERALVEFDDDPSSERADRVELAFVLARQHAERVGIRHAAPEFRDGLRRAVKAARLVVGAGTEGERDAALGQLQRILDSLALYYLPDRVSRPALTGGTNHPEQC